MPRSLSAEIGDQPLREREALVPRAEGSIGEELTRDARERLVPLIYERCEVGDRIEESLDEEKPIGLEALSRRSGQRAGSHR